MKYQVVLLGRVREKLHVSLPIPGQRFISTSEPALGLGHILSTSDGLIEIAFPAVEEMRTYAAGSAPLVRVRFAKGDSVTNHDDVEMLIEKITEEDELLTYHGSGQIFPESELSDKLRFLRPDKKLLAGFTDHPRSFDHRLEALRWNANTKKSPAKGYTGARIDLIPHQLAIVAECAKRPNPRVLLADEVGLGKTIEACLILHRLHLTGRADRILILLPEALVHQWFVELLRRFNLLFSIFDEDRCRSITAREEEANPFADSQLILTSVGFLSENAERAQQAVDAGFDLLIVDEAHHLEWHSDEVSDAYKMVEALAVATPSVLLLTATPQQLGPEGHFARLRLLDPARYSDLNHFIEETEQFSPLAEIIEQLSQGKTPVKLDQFTKEKPAAKALTDQLRAGDETARAKLISNLVDTVGTGRVFFRNTRERLQGFPKRLPLLHPLKKGSSPYNWLADLLRSLPETEKVLLITSSPDAAISIQETLLTILNVETALFHEELSMLERDRNAAYFQEEDGARLLICSEIGSEGRNFQFARHLVLFGLPRDPEVLEQRIGRLDRIGQTGDINIHIPYGKDSKSELQALWLHDGLEAFSEPLKGATTISNELLPKLEAIDPDDKTAFKKFIKETKKLKATIGNQLATGHDRLLELGAPPASQAEELIEAIETADENPKFQKFCLRLFDYQGLDIADLSDRSFLLKRGQRSSDAFADISDDGLSVTFDRTTALSREDLGFLTFDHPLFQDALDQLLSGNQGNASFARLATGQEQSVLLDCAFILETTAPARLELDRFLPPILLRVIVDHNGKPQTKAPAAKLLQKGDARNIVSQEAFKSKLFPSMLKSATEVVKRASKKPISEAIEAAKIDLQQQLERLKDLSSRNDSVSEKEITDLEHKLKESEEVLSKAQVRLDAIRLIYCG